MVESSTSGLRVFACHSIIRMVNKQVDSDLNGNEFYVELRSVAGTSDLERSLFLFSFSVFSLPLFSFLSLSPSLLLPPKFHQG